MIIAYAVVSPPATSESRLLTVSHNLRTDVAVSLDSSIFCEFTPNAKQGLAQISLIPDSKRSLSRGQWRVQM